MVHCLCHVRSWKMILGGHGKFMENFKGKIVGTLYVTVQHCELKGIH